jgi:flavin reductase (DIM6/NTAB) family NADH-FMN oxidoreductase RutF
MSDSEISPLARALGRIPTGLYIVSTRTPDGPEGFVGSFLVQVGFEPPTICVAVGKSRGPLAALRASGHFAVSILDEASSSSMGAFFRGYEGDETPFDHVEHEDTASGGPRLTDALAWLDCAITGEHEVGDHVVLFGEVRDGAQVREGDPSVHLRKNGLSY